VADIVYYVSGYVADNYYTYTADAGVILGDYFTEGYFVDGYFISTGSYATLYCNAISFSIRYVNASASISSAFTQSVTAGSIKSATASMSSAFTQSAQGYRTREIVLQAFSNGALTASVVVNARASITLTTIANIAAQAARLRGITSSLSATAAVSAVISATKNASSTASSQFTQSLTPTRIRSAKIALEPYYLEDYILEGYYEQGGGSASLTASLSAVKYATANIASAFTQTANGQLTIKGNAALSTAFTVNVTARKTARTSSNIASAFTTSITGRKTTGYSSSLASAFLQSATVARTRATGSTIASAFAQSASIGVIKYGIVTVSSAFTQTAIAKKVTSTSITLGSAVTVNVTARKTVVVTATFPSIATDVTVAVKTATNTATLEPRFTVTASFGVIRRATNGPRITGWAIEPQQWVQYVDSNIDNGNGGGLGAGALFSFWARKDNTQPIGGIFVWNTSRSFVGSNGLPGGNWNYNQQYFQIGYDDNTTLAFGAYDESGSAGNANLQVQWTNAVPNDAKWHHYLIYIKEWNVATGGHQRFAAWVDGIAQGEKNAGGYFYGLAVGYSTNIQIGGGRRSSEPRARMDMAQFLIAQRSSFYNSTTDLYDVGSYYGSNGFTTPSLEGQVAYAPGTTSDTHIQGVYNDWYQTAYNPNPYPPSRTGAYDFDPRYETVVSVSAGDVPAQGWTAQASLSSNFVTVIASGAALSSAFTITASAVKYRNITATLTSVATQTATVIKSARLSSSLSSAFTQSATATRVKYGTATVASAATLTATARKVIVTTVAITSAVTTTISARRLRGSEIPLASAFAQSTTATKTLRSTAALQSAFTQSASAQKLIRAQAALTTVAAISTVATRTRSTAIALSSTATIVCRIGQKKDFAVAVTSRFTTTESANYRANHSAAITGRFTVVSRAGVRYQASAYFTAIVTEITVGDVFNILPELQIQVPAESRSKRVLAESRTYTVEQATRIKRVLPESRILTIDQENHLNTVL